MTPRCREEILPRRAPREIHEINQGVWRMVNQSGAEMGYVPLQLTDITIHFFLSHGERLFLKSSLIGHRRRITGYSQVFDYLGSWYRYQIFA